MSKKVIEAFLKGLKVIVPSEEDAKLLYQWGYGTFHEETSYLTLYPHEALYLLKEERIRVSDAENEAELSFPDLVEKLRGAETSLWTKYLVYHDLRKRGYVVRGGFGFGIDFRVYERGEYQEHIAKYVIYGICEGTPIPIEKVREILRFVQSMKKELVMAVVDRRGEIVYYSISQLNL